MPAAYPAGPTDVPADLTAAPPGYQTRAYLAIAALLAFVTVYIALTAWFGVRGYTLLRDSAAGGQYAFRGAVMGVLSTFLAIFLGKALFALRRGSTEGLEVGADEPELLAFVHRIADEVGAARPHRIVITAQVNAAVFYDVSLINLIIPSRKNLLIGIGLVNVLTLSELKAVLAHEFGHFAQRSMAVGRWVYTGQQVAAGIIGKRDILDRMLLGLSRIDIRIAWIGWIVRLIVWSIRSVMDSLFRVVIVAERALSRQMELQADLVAVSISGSDALVHGLHKLRAADEAWDQAAEIAANELAQGRVVPDLFGMQTAVLRHFKETLGQGAALQVPPLPATDRAAHRIFEPELAQPPQMWSTHPPNHVRENNAKRRYIAAPLDQTPAWTLFSDPAAMKTRVTEDLLQPDTDAMRLDHETAIAKVDDFYDHRFVDARYRGLYLRRRVTRAEDKIAALYVDAPTDPVAALRALYPAELTDLVARWRRLEREHAELKALEIGALTAAGGIIHFRGQQLRRRDLAQTLATVKAEVHAARNALRDHDRTVRTVHAAAAAVVGHGWPEYLSSLVALLHYAEHTEANVDDAHAHLMNVLDVVLADDRVSDAERRRTVVSAQGLFIALRYVSDDRGRVQLPPRVAQRMGSASWHEAVGEDLGLVMPAEESIGDFLECQQSWFQAYSGILGSLRHNVLETLLEAEAYVARCAHTAETPEPAPPPAVVPLNYIICRFEDEREQQTRLDWWDRFVTAEGVGPGLARFSVAGVIVGGVLTAGGAIATPTAFVYNGLDQPVEVTLGSVVQRVEPHRRAEIEFDVEPGFAVAAATLQGERIEHFVPTIDNPLDAYIYNIGSAAALVEWTVVYGGNQPEPVPTFLGAKRWTSSDADHIFEEPPDQVRTRGAVASRRVLAAVDDLAPEAIAEVLPDAPQQQMYVLAHARWDAIERAQPLVTAFPQLDGMREVVTSRFQEAPHDVALGRLAQDYGNRALVCTAHQAASDGDADDSDGDAAYLAARCIDDSDTRDGRFAGLAKQFPDNPWLQWTQAGHHWEHGDLTIAATMLQAVRRHPDTRVLLDPAAMLEARIRIAVEGPDVDLSDLGAVSERVAAVLPMLGTTQDTDNPYVALQRGDIEQAVAQSEQSDHLLRLAAASEGASESVIERSNALPPSRGISPLTILPTIALVRRAAPSKVSAYVDAARQMEALSDVDTMLLFTDAEVIADIAAAEKLRQGLSRQERALVTAAGIVTLGVEAPASWRQETAAALLPFERPYFGLDVPDTPADAAPTEP